MLGNRYIDFYFMHLRMLIISPVKKIYSYIYQTIGKKA
jgi:hypothetical protein